VPILPRHATANVPATLAEACLGKNKLQESLKLQENEQTAAMMLRMKQEEWSYLSAPSSELQEEMAASDRRMTQRTSTEVGTPP
jgi:parvulin-like peptidyl-prolyl isomerase